MILPTYSCYSYNNRIREQSSSGGVFYSLAERVLAQGGIVYGVVMSEDCYRAEYSRARTLSEIKRMMGSKYIQAYLGNTLKNVKKDLEEKNEVLFTGTPCQVNGLKNYLQKDYTNLVCVDVVCHGVPSRQLWEKYVRYCEKKYKHKIKDVNFRCKDVGWKNFGLKRTDLNNKKIFISKDLDPYMSLFLKNYSLRPSCYNCKAKNNKKADLTIGDFWGIERIEPELNDGKGVSLVIIRTDKGEKIFQDIEHFFRVAKVNYLDAIKDNSAENESVIMPPERNSFYKDINLDFNNLIKKYLPKLRYMIVRKKVKNMILNISIKCAGGVNNVNFNYGLLFVLLKED